MPETESDGVATGALALPDEDTFTLPSSWHRLLQPRRGGVVRKVTLRDEHALRGCEQLLTLNALVVEHALANPASDTELVEAARAHRNGSPNPLGAAVVAVAVQGEGYEPFADLWATRHGLPFAARAVAQLFELTLDLKTPSADSPRTSVKRLAGGEQPVQTHRRRPVADRMRALIAAADEDTYRAVVAALAEHRDTVRRRVVVAYLLPTETAWVTEACAQPGRSGKMDDALTLMLLHSLGNAEQRDLLTWPIRLGWRQWTLSTFATVAEGLGRDAVPVIADLLNGITYHSVDYFKAACPALAELPGDEAFGLLLRYADDRYARAALSTSAKRQPARALRLLAAAVHTGGTGRQTAPARELLLVHVSAHRELVQAVLPTLPAEHAAVVTPLLTTGDRVADAPAEDLPALLVGPPWTGKRKTAKPRVVNGLAPSAERRVDWAPGEQEDWAVDRSFHLQPSPVPDLDTRIATLREGRLSWYLYVDLFVKEPAERVAPLLADWDPGECWDSVDILKPIAARHGALALPPVLRVAGRGPAAAGVLLLPFLDLETARLMADWMVRLKSAGGTARTWFTRHGLAAAALLVPDAVGPVGAGRKRAEQALRFLAARHGTDGVREAAAAGYGAEAADAVAELLAADPLEAALPARTPIVGEWADPALLPQILLVKGGALPAEAVRHVLTMLALCKPGERYPGLDVVLGVCERESLAEFAWAVFERWRQAAMPAKESWALHALTWFGDDATVRRLSPVLRAWPGEGMHQRAAEGLDVLCGIGTDVALMHLHGIAQRVPFKALKTRAQEKIAEVAAGLGLTGDQLADRLVPDLGLDPDGSTRINYGPRSFTVGFDELLRPYVLDADGKRRKDLPAPNSKDDPQLAPAERKRFAALKKDVRTIATDQVRRLEAAMVTGRTWTGAEFQELLVDHPLTRHLTRRLIWTHQAEGGSAPVAFRVAEDHSFADIQDDTLTLPGDTTIRLAHPLHLDPDQLAAWSELLTDYEILQPFPQLGRPTHTLTGHEATSSRLTRFEGATVPVGKLLGLQKHGWERGQPMDAGIECWMSRKVSEDHYLVISLHPGIAVGMVNELGDQTLESVSLADRPGYFRPAGTESEGLALGGLDPVMASELIADLTELVAK